ncbi:hypothetical protein Slala05_82820 [Streptomyces lavendulae subsp. lavendulae]|nr:hypothetical protein Slala05_82820 [Streptomyces lavendulae subsp. lavendulae]
MSLPVDGGQAQGVGAAAVAPGVVDKFGDDQDHAVRTDGRPQSPEEAPGLGDSAIGTGGWGVGVQRVPLVLPALSPRRCRIPARQSCPGPQPANPAGCDFLITGHPRIYGDGSRHWAVTWLWFLS